MKYTTEDVQNYIEEEDVKFIRLVFTDINGIQKNISIMPNRLQEAFHDGISICGNAITGYEKAKRLILHPDPNTISLLPWRPSQGRVIRMFCNLKTEDHQDFVYDSRKILQQAIKETESEEKEIKFRSCFAFYLFQLDSEGVFTSIPYDHAGYMDIAPADKGENVRRQICLSLAEMEIPTYGSLHEAGPAQNRIFLASRDVLKAAEDAITFESVVKTIASRNGIGADFSYEPIQGENPSRNSIHIKGKAANLEKYYCNLKNHYDEIYLFLNDTEDGYQEYDEEENVILDPLEKEIVINRVSSHANSYLAYALLLYAMMDDSEQKQGKATSKQAAVALAKESLLIKEHLPQEILEKFTR